MVKISRNYSKILQVDKNLRKLLKNLSSGINVRKWTKKIASLFDHFYLLTSWEFSDIFSPETKNLEYSKGFFGNNT